MSLADGEILDSVDLSRDALPNGSPCWFPGTLAQVLYPGSDGGIFRIDFETTRTDEGVGNNPEIRPRALAWRTRVPGEGDSILNDLAWPAGPGLGGRLLVSLRFKHADSRDGLKWQIWWLKLDPSGTSIIAAGQLLQPATGEEPDARRFPILLTDAGVSPALAYLAKIPMQQGYQLRVAPIHLDPGSKVPHASDAEARVLAQGCLPAAPAFSADGRWVTVLRPEGASARAERLALHKDPTLVARLP
jgi:hypothetical protein